MRSYYDCSPCDFEMRNYREEYVTDMAFRQFEKIKKGAHNLMCIDDDEMDNYLYDVAQEYFNAKIKDSVWSAVLGLDKLDFHIIIYCVDSIGKEKNWCYKYHKEAVEKAFEPEDY